jgi:hypothetical protein
MKSSIPPPSRIETIYKITAMQKGCK